MNENRFEDFPIEEEGGSIVNISFDLGINAPNQNLNKNKGVDNSKQPVKKVSY